CEDYFSRGGIAIGRMRQVDNGERNNGQGMHDELFGPGIVRAVELERVVAKHPRIVVSARLAAAAIRVGTLAGGRRIYCPDLMELPYIDYLSFAESIGPERPREVLAGHAELVHNLVIRSQRRPSLRPKAAWLLEYHNSHVRMRGGLDDLIVRVTVEHPSDDGEEQETDGPSGLEAMRLRPEALRPVE